MLLRTELRMLLRAPWRTALLCVLLAAAVGAASLGGGLLAASDAGMAELAEKYTTMAVLKVSGSQYGEKYLRLKSLAEETEHARLNSRKIYGGYIPGIHTSTSLKETLELELNSRIEYYEDSEVRKRTGNQSCFDEEYGSVAFVATCIEKKHEEVDPLAAEYLLEAGEFVLRVEEVYYAHESYEIPEIIVSYFEKTTNGYDNSSLYEVGKQYFIAGNIRFPDMVEAGYLAQINVAYHSTDGYFDRYEIDGTLQETLQGESGARIAQLMRGCEIANNSITVLSTERLNGILPFNHGELYLIQGRDFTAQEYADGASVCIMSEKLAEMNGLSIGDTISVELYQTSASVYESEAGTYEWNRIVYNDFDGPFDQNMELKIVGLFSTPAWDFQQRSQTLSPNTVIIPAQHTKNVDEIYWPASMYSILIDNGHAEEFLAEMEELEPGSSEYFVIYDQGYSEVAPTIEAFTKNARYVAMGCAAVFMLAAGVFLAFAAAKNRHDLGVMRSLGATKARTEGAFLLRCGMPTVAGGVLGALAGQVLFGRAVAVLGAEELISRPAGTLWVIAAGCTAAVICFAALAGAMLVNRKPQALMREKE